MEARPRRVWAGPARSDHLGEADVVADARGVGPGVVLVHLGEGIDELREVDRDALRRPVAARADGVAAHHRALELVLRIDLELVLVGLAEVDLDLLAFAMQRM